MSKKNPLDDPQNKAKIEHFLLEHAPLLNMHVKALQNEGRIPADVDPTDLHMAGFQGLMNAAHKYDPKVGASFQTYANKKIRGHMTDYIRDQWAVPVTVNKEAKNIRALGQQPEIKALKKPGQS